MLWESAIYIYDVLRRCRGSRHPFKFGRAGWRKKHIYLCWRDKGWKGAHLWSVCKVGVGARLVCTNSAVEILSYFWVVKESAHLLFAEPRLLRGKFLNDKASFNCAVLFTLRPMLTDRL